MIKTLCSISSKYSLLSIKYYSSNSLKTHYQLLQVDSSANFKQIKDKYIQKSKIYHPDVSPNTYNLYQEIQNAYRVLITPQSRKKYDLSLGIQYSLWEKELLNDKFKSQFQMEGLYAEILKPQKQYKKSSPLFTVQQQLQKKFQGEIAKFNRNKILTNTKFISIILGMSGLWFVWCGVQILYLNYEGKKTHKIQKIHTETALKIIPLFSR